MASGRFNVRMTEAHENAVAAEAERDGVTVSRWCALVISKALARRGHQLPDLPGHGGFRGERHPEEGE